MRFFQLIRTVMSQKQMIFTLLSPDVRAEISIGLKVSSSSSESSQKSACEDCKK